MLRASHNGKPQSRGDPYTRSDEAKFRDASARGSGEPGSIIRVHPELSSTHQPMPTRGIVATTYSSCPILENAARLRMSGRCLHHPCPRSFRHVGRPLTACISKHLYIKTNKLEATGCAALLSLGTSHDDRPETRNASLGPQKRKDYTYCAGTCLDV